MTLSEFEGHFCCLKSEGVIKVTGSHVHFKSGSILETVLDRDAETTLHKQEVIYGLFNSSSCNDLWCMSRLFMQAFSNRIFLSNKISILTSALHGPSAIAELLVFYRPDVLASTGHNYNYYSTINFC